jgi:PAS domain S-box-containing protein
MWLNLDYLTILRLPSLILSIGCSVYLFVLRSRRRSTVLLAWGFAGSTLFHLATVLEFAGDCYWRPQAVKTIIQPLLQVLGPATFLVALLLFAYQFPRRERDWVREQRLALALSLIVNSALIGLTLVNFVVLQGLQSDFGFESAYYLVLYTAVAVQFLVVVSLLLRKVARLSGRDRGPLWLRLARPSGADARAARAVCAVLLLPLGAIAIWLLRLGRLLPAVATAYLVWFCFLLFHISFVVVYLNHTGERTTVQVRLVAGALVAVLGILSVAAVSAGLWYERDYVNRDIVTEGRTICFSPNGNGSYTVTAAELAYDPDVGAKLSPFPEAGRRVDLPFAFSFFGEPYRSLSVLDGPIVRLGERSREDGWGGYHPDPVIAPIIMDLDAGRGGGIWFRSRQDSAMLTWLALPEVGSENANTVQLALRADGSFAFSYKALAPDPSFRATQWHAQTTVRLSGLDPGAGGARSQPAPPSLVGIHPGGREAALEPVNFTRDLPYVGRGRAAIYEAYDIAYHRYMHERMAPFAVIFVAASLLVLSVYPVAVGQSLIRPLRLLYQGMKKADAGDLEVTVRPQHNDEIGFLSDSFNQMISSIRRMQADFRSLVDDSQDAIVILRPDGRPVYTNASARRITGRSAEEVMNMDFGGLLRQVEAGITGASDGESRHFETEIAFSRGPGVPVEVAASRTLWMGAPARVAVIRDISARRRREERARERLQDLMRTDKLVTLGVLAAGMAHEIAGANQAILSEITLLQRACPELLAVLGEGCTEGYLLGGLDQATFRLRLPRLLSAVADAARHIDSVVQNLRAFSRERPQAPESDVDVNAAVRSAIELVSTAITRATESFAARMAEDLPPVRGNAQKIEQIVVNLVLNACQSLADRTRRVSVSTRCEKNGERVAIEVADQGVGISRESMGRLARLFYTTRQAQGGTGLGLYIVQSIVDEHGGTLEFDSQPGSGTKATVRLPRAART